MQDAVATLLPTVVRLATLDGSTHIATAGEEAGTQSGAQLLHVRHHITLGGLVVDYEELVENRRGQLTGSTVNLKLHGRRSRGVHQIIQILDGRVGIYTHLRRMGSERIHGTEHTVQHTVTKDVGTLAKFTIDQLGNVEERTRTGTTGQRHYDVNINLLARYRHTLVVHVGDVRHLHPTVLKGGLNDVEDILGVETARRTHLTGTIRNTVCQAIGIAGEDPAVSTSFNTALVVLSRAAVIGNQQRIILERSEQFGVLDICQVEIYSQEGNTLGDVTFAINILIQFLCLGNGTDTGTTQTYIN